MKRPHNTFCVTSHALRVGRFFGRAEAFLYRHLLLKNFFRTSSRLESDRSRRKRMLNFALIAFGSLMLITLGICLLSLGCQCLPAGYVGPVFVTALVALLLTAVLFGVAIHLLNQFIQTAQHQDANIEVIMNSVKDGILLLDPQGNYVSANRALIRMIPEERLKEINSRPLEETLEWKHTVFSVTAASLPETGSVVIFRDETRRHEADRAKDALLSTVSHEFRTPLGSVMNYIELLMQLLEIGRVDNEKFATYLVRAHENSLRLLRLINNVIDQAQLQAGGLELERESCNLFDLLKRSHALLSEQIAEKHLSYKLTIAPDVPAEMMSDSERLHQVLVNLIGNAIKFTHKGGVTVRVWLPQKDMISIEVADTGPGIPAEQLPDIFEAFRRGSNYAQRHEQGAGLGLSISRELVRLMGGEISAESTVGVGSVFTISLPLVRVPVN